MITKFKSVTLPTGESLTYYRSDGGTCTIDVRFGVVGPAAVSVTAGSFEDALLTLSARFRTLAIEIDNLANAAKLLRAAP